MLDFRKGPRYCVEKYSLRCEQAGVGIVWLLGPPVTAEEPHRDVRNKVSWEEPGAMVVLRLLGIQAPLDAVEELRMKLGSTGI